MEMINRLLLLMLIISFAVCNTPEEALPQSDMGKASGEYRHGVFIVNEGNFDWGHGSLSHFNPETGQVSQHIFKQKNGFELGNIAHSLSLANGKGYVVLNNSARIEVVNPYTMEWEGRIELPKSSPRNMLPLSSRKAYVTDLYADHFYVIDLQTDKLIKTISTSGWTESMVRLNNYVYMTQSRTALDMRKEGGRLLLKIDASTDQIIDSLALPAGPVEIQVDATNKLWVLCSGNRAKEIPAALVRIHPQTLTIEQSFDFPILAETQAGCLRIDESGTMLYYLNGGLFRLPIDAEQLEKEPLVPANGRLFYTLGYDPVRQQLYISDVVDYVQKGWVFRYTTEGAKLDSFQVGVIPTEFVFY
jgi:hypothetical protein